MYRTYGSRATRHTTTSDGGSADIASLHGCNLLGQCRSYCRGANICPSIPGHASLLAISATAPALPYLPTSMWVAWHRGIRPPRMVEVQILHRYMDVTYQGNAGAIAEEQISVRPSMDITAPPSMALCGIPSIHGHKKRPASGPFFIIFVITIFIYGCILTTNLFRQVVTIRLLTITD